MQLHTFADVDAAVLPYWSEHLPRHAHGLEHMHRLLEHLGNPHKRLRIIHVAGTSGKTSTAYYAAALLQAAGKRVGLTVSPHVHQVSERAQINLAPLPEAVFTARFGEYLALVRSSGVTPNYFELFMAFALWEFAKQQVDYAVVEVGIGGLLDSSNVFDDPRKVCIITDIGFDHTKALGRTLPEIAAHKAGIIGLHNPVFCYKQDDGAIAAIQKQAITKQADLHVLTNVPKAANLPFLPLFQQRNFGLALQAMQYVAERDGLDLSASRIRQAAQTSILGRMEEYYSHDKTIILDVAHNPQKFGSLLASVRAKYATQDIAVLVRLPSGSRTSKRSQAIVQLLQRNVQYVHIVDSADDPLQAFNEVMQRAEPVVIVASFYLLNYIRPVVRAAYGADLKPVTRV